GYWLVSECGRVCRSVVLARVDLLHSSCLSTVLGSVLSQECLRCSMSLPSLGARAQEMDFFFFQAEDGIRYWSVTGVQTCALPICGRRRACGRQPAAVLREGEAPLAHSARREARPPGIGQRQIGRASCREREMMFGGSEVFKKREEGRKRWTNGRQAIHTR